MARIRSIHPGLASDEAFMSMSMAAKAAWSILWTECDDHGVFEWKPIVLKARIFPADNVDFAAVLGEYETLECVRRIEVDGKPFGIIRNFCKFQRPKNPSYRFPFPAEARLFVGVSGSPPPALPESSPSPTEKPPQMKEEGGKMKEEKEERSSLRSASSNSVCVVSQETRKHDDWPKDYRERFWNAYPRKTARKPALKVLDRIFKSDAVSFAAIMAGISRIPIGEARFVPHGATWLNAERWNDEIPASTFGGSNAKAPANSTGQPWQQRRDKFHDALAELQQSIAADREADPSESGGGQVVRIDPSAGRGRPEGLDGGGCGDFLELSARSHAGGD
jgi:hypothetical protein